MSLFISLFQRLSSFLCFSVSLPLSSSLWLFLSLSPPPLSSYPSRSLISYPWQIFSTINTYPDTSIYPFRRSRVFGRRELFCEAVDEGRAGQSVHVDRLSTGVRRQHSAALLPGVWRSRTHHHLVRQPQQHPSRRRRSVQCKCRCSHARWQLSRAIGSGLCCCVPGCLCDVCRALLIPFAC